MIEKITDEQLREGQRVAELESKGFNEMNELELLRHIAKTSNRTSLNVAFMTWTTIVSIAIIVLSFLK